jgi:hypothetical protein
MESSLVQVDHLAGEVGAPEAAARLAVLGARMSSSVREQQVAHFEEV